MKIRRKIGKSGVFEWAVTTLCPHGHPIGAVSIERAEFMAEKTEVKLSIAFDSRHLLGDCPCETAHFVLSVQRKITEPVRMSDAATVAKVSRHYAAQAFSVTTNATDQMGRSVYVEHVSNTEDDSEGCDDYLFRLYVKDGAARINFKMVREEASLNVKEIN